MCHGFCAELLYIFAIHFERGDILSLQPAMRGVFLLSYSKDLFLIDNRDIMNENNFIMIVIGI